MKLKTINKAAFLLLTIFIISVNSSKDLSVNRFTMIVSTIVEGLKGGTPSDKSLMSNLPVGWVKNTDDQMARAAQKLLNDLAKKLDKFFPVLTNQFTKPCELRDRVKESLKSDPPLLFLQTSLKSDRKLHNHLKRYAPFDETMKKHAFVVNAALNEFFKTEFYVTLRVVLQTFQTASDATPEFKSKITTFLTNVNTFGSGTDGFIEATVDALCNYDDFKKALLALGKAKLETEEISRWKQYGDFFVHLAMAYGTPSH